MRKTKIVVPRGIRYISEWNGFNLPDYPCILDKQLTGCGFTEYCLMNSENVILCSPRKILLENKETKYPDLVFYLENVYEKPTRVDKDLKSKETYVDDETSVPAEKFVEMQKSVMEYYLRQFNLGLPTKILVTYDSFKIVKDALGDLLQNFRIIIDEFQSIFIDSKFKGSTEIDFLSQIQGVSKLCFASATPMMDEYLELLDEFKDLPYYELDWISDDPGRASNPQLEVIECRSTVQEALRIIDEYKSEEFEIGICPGTNIEVESREAVIYVNSVKNICDIIKKAGLTLENTNILCANTPENKTKLRKALGIKEKGVEVFGKVPLEGEPHKMFTLCTRTVYLGADFCSPCARTFIFADANIDSLSVDISLDLPQILGRQRLDCNPWKSRAEMYVKTLSDKNKMTEEERNRIIDKKMKRTKDLLISYYSTPEESRQTVAENLLYIANSKNYKDDYVAVNVGPGKELTPVLNNLVRVADKRTFDIQQIDYEKRVTVFNAVNNISNQDGIDKINELVDKFKTLGSFPDKLKFVCTTGLSPELQNKFLERIPMQFVRLYIQLGPERCKANSYRQSLVFDAIKVNADNLEVEDDVAKKIYENFSVGGRYKKAEIKEKLRSLYSELGYNKTPKATDLEEYFEMKPCKITDDSGEIIGFKLLNRKLL